MAFQQVSLTRLAQRHIDQMLRLEKNNIPLITTYIALMALSVLMFFSARNFPGSSMGAAGPGFFPQVVAVILLLLSGFGFLQTFRTVQERVIVPSNVVVAMTFSIGYIGLMNYIGYYISTFVFAFIVMWVSRQGASVFVVLRDSAVMLIVSYVFFGLVIEAHLPTGVLFR